MPRHIVSRSRRRVALAAIRFRLGLLGLRCRLARAHLRQSVDNTIGVTAASALTCIALACSPLIALSLLAQRFPTVCGLLLAVWLGYFGTYYSGWIEPSDRFLTGEARYFVHTVVPVAWYGWGAVAGNALVEMAKARRARGSKASTRITAI